MTTVALGQVIWAPHQIVVKGSVQKQTHTFTLMTHDLYKLFVSFSFSLQLAMDVVVALFGVVDSGTAPGAAVANHHLE